VKILFHVAQGPEPSSRAALAFLIAKVALDEGHSVSLYLSGDSARLLRAGAMEEVSDRGLGKLTGKLGELYDAIAAGGAKFYVAGTPGNGCGLTAADLRGRPAEFAAPDLLRRLLLEHDEVLTY
jgi:uncharacterized protein